MKSLRAIERVKAARARASAVGHAIVECPPPGILKYIAETVTVPNAGSATARLTAPGTFCPLRMYIVSDDLELILVSSIKVGLEEQIVNRQPVTGITGVLPATMFGTENHCCPQACMPCMCAPEVPLEVTLFNTDVTPEDVTVVLVGTHIESCGPMATDPCFEKYVGFTLALTANETETVSITTPGRFCPRNMFLADFTSGDIFLPFASLISIQSGLKEQIITGNIPGSLFGKQNKCCTLQCFDCLCMPGYPLKITFHNEIAGGEGSAYTVNGALVGTYVDAC